MRHVVEGYQTECHHEERSITEFVVDQPAEHAINHIDKEEHCENQRLKHGRKPSECDHNGHGHNIPENHHEVQKCEKDHTVTNLEHSNRGDCPVEKEVHHYDQHNMEGSPGTQDHVEQPPVGSQTLKQGEVCIHFFIARPFFMRVVGTIH